LGKGLKDCLRLAEVVGEQIGWVAGNPLLQIDRLVIARVQADQNAADTKE
jgi:hypothetical protein